MAIRGCNCGDNNIPEVYINWKKTEGEDAVTRFNHKFTDNGAVTVAPHPHQTHTRLDQDFQRDVTLAEKVLPCSHDPNKI